MNVFQLGSLLKSMGCEHLISDDLFSVLLKLSNGQLLNDPTFDFDSYV